MMDSLRRSRRILNCLAGAADLVVLVRYALALAY